MSVSGGLSSAFERAQSIGINTMQVFTKNQNRWEQKPAVPDEIARWFGAQQATGIGPVVSMQRINMGSPDEALWNRSVNAMIDELTRAEQLGILGVVVHPGAHMGAGEEAGLARIAAALDRAHAATTGYRTLTLLEATAGQGSALGYRFEQLRAMRDGVREPDRVAFCPIPAVFLTGCDIGREPTRRHRERNSTTWGWAALFPPTWQKGSVREWTSTIMGTGSLAWRLSLHLNDPLRRRP
jgi:deoxyribonuclease-4